jgi:hypothetical protein
MEQSEPIPASVDPAPAEPLAEPVVYTDLLLRVRGTETHVFVLGGPEGGGALWRHKVIPADRIAVEDLLGEDPANWPVKSPHA